MNLLTMITYYAERSRLRQAQRDLARDQAERRAKLEANAHRRAALKGHARRREGAGA